MPLNDSESKVNDISQLKDQVFIESLRNQMYKFANLQLRDTHLAEDAVQEALVSALKKADSFEGHRATVKTWVFAILRNKIIDIFRKKKRTVDTNNLVYEDNESKLFSELFDVNTGFWLVDKRPVIWKNPEESMKNDQFWLVFETCLEDLSENQARVFMMREFIELDSNEICETVGITYRNLNVLMHRARIRLRQCLEDRWFKR